MSLKVSYTDNLAINAKLPGQVTADFKEVEQEDARDDAKLDQEIQNRKDADAKEASERKAADEDEASNRENKDNDLQDQLNNAKERISVLEDQVATLKDQVATLKDQEKDHEGRIMYLESQNRDKEQRIKYLEAQNIDKEQRLEKIEKTLYGTLYINDTDDKELDDSMVDYPEDVEVNDTKVIEDDKAVIDTSDQGYVTAGEEVN